MSSVPRAMVEVGTLVYNLALFVGTAYLVGWHGWSAWWFLLAMIMTASVEGEK